MLPNQAAVKVILRIVPDACVLSGVEDGGATEVSSHPIRDFVRRLQYSGP